MRLFAALLLGARSAAANDGRCTATAIDAGAMQEGGSVVTHTSDCSNCDFRLAKVEAYDLESPVVSRSYRAMYPTEVSNRSQTWRALSLEFAATDLDEREPPFENAALGAQQKAAWASAEWLVKSVVGSFPVHELERLANSTRSFGSVEASYGIANEAGLAIGESTCEARLPGILPRACADCEGPLLDITQLSRIALRACETSRCAVRVMGGLAELYGYYAAELTPGEAGEALTLGDGAESWVLHVLPDDTGLSAVWTAKRVPPKHVAAVGNMFIIRGVPAVAFEESDARTACLWERDVDCDFIASTNLEAVAKRTGLYEQDANGLIDFTKTYGPEPVTNANNHYFLYSTRRVWRIFSLVAPVQTAKLVEQCGGVADPLGSELPFSIEAERTLTVHDVLAMNRDYYEGSRFDLTVGLSSGPWGDPNRFDGAMQGNAHSAPEAWPELASADEVRNKGRYERVVSMFRTSYSTVVLSTKRDHRAVVWFAQGAPHAAVYSPILPKGAISADNAVARGSLFVRTHDSLFWATDVVANWLRANTFKFAIRDVRDAQLAVERRFAKDVAAVHEGDETAHNARVARSALTAWTQLFDKLCAKYRDGYRVSSENVDEIKVFTYFYPEWWLKAAGDYFTQKNNYYQDAPHVGVDGDGDDPADDDNDRLVVPAHPVPVSQQIPSWIAAPLSFLALALAAFLGVLVGRNAERSDKAKSNGSYGTVQQNEA